MSADEIRTQKALALLEFTEAAEALRKLEEERDVMARNLSELAGDVLHGKRNPKYAGLTAQAAFDLVERVNEAKRVLEAAFEKKKQFGL
jgi:hypothetical protein